MTGRNWAKRETANHMWSSDRLWSGGRDHKQLPGKLFRQVEHHVMAACHANGPPALGFSPVMKMCEWSRAPARCQDESHVLDPSDFSRQPQRLLEGGQGLGGALPVHPSDISGVHVEGLGGNRRHLPSVAARERLL